MKKEEGLQSIVKTCDEFVFLYESKMFKPLLHKNIVFLFDALNKNKTKQFILSASNEKHLIKTVKHYGLVNVFSDIVGTKNFVAEGKISLAKNNKK